MKTMKDHLEQYKVRLIIHRKRKKNLQKYGTPRKSHKGKSLIKKTSFLVIQILFEASYVFSPLNNIFDNCYKTPNIVNTMVKNQ